MKSLFLFIAITSFSIVYGQCNGLCDYFKIEPITIEICQVTNYSLKFEDNFDGKGLDTSVWMLVPWMQGTLNDAGTLGVNTLDEDNVEVSDGTLKIKLTNKKKSKKTINYMDPNKVMEDGVENRREYRYSGSNIWTRESFFKEGKYEIRARMGRLDGMWPAFWLYSGDGSTPGGTHWNELDFFEIYYKKDKWKFTTNVHYDYDNDGSTSGNRCPSEKKMKDLDEWHVFTFYYTENSLEFYIDGELIERKFKYRTWTGRPVYCKKPKRKARREMYGWPREESHLILNMALENLKGDTPRDTSLFPCVFEVDYVRYWEVIKN